MADEKMSLIDKLAKEADRNTQDDWQKVYLYKEGTFFHAFNESAWLLRLRRCLTPSLDAQLMVKTC